MRWPNLPVICNKRDTDAAFKNSRVNPDVGIILRAEPPAPPLGIEDDAETVILLYLALPIGWRAIARYPSKIGGGVTAEHQEYASSNPERGEIAGGFPVVCRRYNLRGSRSRQQEGTGDSAMEYVCRNISGAGAINDDKFELGACDTTHILLGFEINAEALTIRLPTEKGAILGKRLMTTCSTMVIVWFLRRQCEH